MGSFNGGGEAGHANLQGPPGATPQASYANVTRQQKFQDIEDLNVLQIRVRKSPEFRDRLFSDQICEQLLKLIKINPKSDTLGGQYLPDKGNIVVEITLTRAKEEWTRAKEETRAKED